MEKHFYEVYLKWEEGRKGIISSPDIPLKFEVATPPEFEKGIPGIWSPEHLFTAAVVSCFMTTFLAISEFSNLKYEQFDCNAEGILEKVDGKFMISEIDLYVNLKVTDIEKKDKAERILQKSKTACLISNSIKTKVNLKTYIYN